MVLSAEDHHLWAKIATLYYEDDLTQGEIAKKLGYSRVKIHRILRSAKEAGIVQVQINSPNDKEIELEGELIRRYQLRDCVVVEEGSPGEQLYTSLAKGAATWLKQHLRPNIRVGLGLGRTLSYLPRVFEVEKEVSCTFTEIAGAVSDHNWGFESNSIASRMAEACGGRAELFYAPTLVSSPELKEQLIQERSVKKSLDSARSCDIVLQSVGPVNESAILYIHGYISREELNNLHQAGAVGDALGCYFDREGSIVPSPTADKMIGLCLTELVEIPWSVLVAGGAEKVLPISSALRGNYFNVLISDAGTAETLLEKDFGHAE